MKYTTTTDLELRFNREISLLYLNKDFKIPVKMTEVEHFHVYLKIIVVQKAI
jgi:hypothetical protein